MLLAWFYVLVLFSASTVAINRPVYKIVLTQKGYAQFLQYDIETPPLREFTFCSWFRIYELNNDQTLFTYVSSGMIRLVRLWLDAKSGNINVSIDDRVTSSAPIDVTKDVWRHVCLSYQSDYGAWAVYVDSRLISCQASQSLNGYILPGGGSVIIGYGTDSNGVQNGFEGEVFGANMILRSTIERNYTIKNNPKYEQKPFHKNKLKYDDKNVKYIILNDLLTEEVINNFETTQGPRMSTTELAKNFIRIRTPHNSLEHQVGSDLKIPGTTSYTANDKDVFNFFVTDKQTTNVNIDEQREASFESLPTLSEYETPPPTPIKTMFDKLRNEFAVNMFPNADSVYELNESTTECRTCTYAQRFPDELYEVEMPPPPEERNPKVYGQWTSSNFAGNVFNYLRSINLRTSNNKQKKVIPQTIPLTKTSDSFPYPSDFKIVKARPPIPFQRKYVVGKHIYDARKTPQINLQILEDDLRSNILKYHSETSPQNVEIINRGISDTRPEQRFSRDVNHQKVNHDSSEHIKNKYHVKPLGLAARKQKADANLQNQYLMSILPFLKSLEYFMGNSRETDAIPQQEASTSNAKNNDVYTRSLSLGNKWHNVKSYSNDYTPREIKIGFNDSQRNMEEKIAQINKKAPGIRLRYRHKDRSVVPKDDDTIIKGRELAMEVSNQSNSNIDSVSIFNYNHGFLPDKKAKSTEKELGGIQPFHLKTSKKNNFHRRVKIGNALNERLVIGDDVETNKRSFVGGDESVPDINKFRAEPESTREVVMVPHSLGPRICKNLELYDRVLYVQPDESIDMSHIMSPVRLKNVGIEFVMQNYKKCSLQESNLQNNAMLFIDWSKTPVRLFGGAYARKTTDLCGFF